MDKQPVVYPYNGLLLSNKNELLIYATCVNLKIFLLSEISWTEKKKKRLYIVWLIDLHSASPLTLYAILLCDESPTDSDIVKVNFQFLNTITLFLVPLRNPAGILNFTISQIPKLKRGPKRILLKKSNMKLSRNYSRYISHMAESMDWNFWSFCQHSVSQDG